MSGFKVYEDKNYVCVVMELCTGGELLDAIVKKGVFSEKDAAAKLRCIAETVAHCHRMGVIHRDLKVCKDLRWSIKLAI
jgi:calcium-dependent protein kinase